MTPATATVAQLALRSDVPVLLTRRVVLAMIKQRAAAGGLPASTCCHTFRATGITAYLSNGGDAGARPADRWTRVAQDDEALRPDGGRGDGQRDRAHRDLNGLNGLRRVDPPPGGKGLFRDRLRPASRRPTAPSCWTCSATPCRRPALTRSTSYHDFASGVPDDRPGLDSLPARPAEGRRARRLEARPPRPKPRHLVNTVQDLSARGVGLRVLAGQGARQIDTTTAAGRLVFERELIRERTVAATVEGRRPRGGGESSASSSTGAASGTKPRPSSEGPRGVQPGPRTARRARRSRRGGDSGSNNGADVNYHVVGVRLVTAERLVVSSSSASF